MKQNKKLGQVFLINERIADVEAAHAEGKVVIEIGPGSGMLTRALCKNAKKVIAVEKDDALFSILKYENIGDNIVLINKDFFDATDSELQVRDADILISNIPYYLSSKVIGWLAEKKMQAVICLQKEFVDHMLATPGTANYSKLSVISSLLFRVTKIMDVPRGNFRPVPKVDSVIVYIKPNGRRISRAVLEYVGLIMQHKKKTLRNAIIDSREKIGLGKDMAAIVAGKINKSDLRVFKLSPEEILKAAKDLDELV